jgi:hypothetical protein
MGSGLLGIVSGITSNIVGARRAEQAQDDNYFQQMAGIMAKVADPDNPDWDLKQKAQAHQYLVESLGEHGNTKEDKQLAQRMGEFLKVAIPARYAQRLHAQQQKQIAAAGAPDRTDLGLQTPQNLNYLPAFAGTQQQPQADAAAAPAQAADRAATSAATPAQAAPRGGIHAALRTLAGIGTGVGTGLEQAFTGMPRNVTRNWPRIPDPSLVGITDQEQQDAKLKADLASVDQSAKGANLSPEKIAQMKEEITLKHFGVTPRIPAETAGTTRLTQFKIPGDATGIWAPKKGQIVKLEYDPKTRKTYDAVGTEVELPRGAEEVGPLKTTADKPPSEAQQSWFDAQDIMAKRLGLLKPDGTPDRDRLTPEQRQQAKREADQGTIGETPYQPPKAGTVKMTSPDGKDTMDVPAADVEHYRKLGATVVGGQGTPGQPSPTVGRNEAVLAGKPPTVVNIVKGLVDYSYPLPSGFSLANPKGIWADALALAKQYDPSFDATMYPTRLALKRSYLGDGKNADNIKRINTLVGHLNRMYASGMALANTPSGHWYSGILNHLNEAGRMATQDPRLTKFNMDVGAAETELAAIFKGTGAAPGEKEIAEWRKTVNAASSPEEIQAAVREGVELMYSRMDAMRDQWDKTMAIPFNMRFFTPEAAKILQQITGKAPQ